LRCSGARHGRPRASGRRHRRTSSSRGRLVISGAGSPATPRLLRDFEGFAVSSTVIMLNMQALDPLPRQCNG
jgi:hypothetical protein